MEHEPPGQNLNKKEINIKEFFRTIRRRLWVLLLTVVLFTIAGGYYASLPETPLYSATARIIIYADSAEMISTQKVFVREPLVMSRVIEQLDLRRSIGALRNQVRVGTVDGSLITLIQVTDEDPALAVAIANAVVQAYKQLTLDIFNFSGIKILSPAQETEHPQPINPKSNRALYFGFVAGAVAGLGLIFLLDSLDDSIRSKRDIEQLLGMNVLGQVSRIKKKDIKQTHKRKGNPSIRGESLGA